MGRSRGEAWKRFTAYSSGDWPTLKSCAVIHKSLKVKFTISAIGLDVMFSPEFPENWLIAMKLWGGKGSASFLFYLKINMGIAIQTKIYDNT